MMRLILTTVLALTFVARGAHLYPQPPCEAREAAGYVVTVDGERAGVAAVRNSAMPVNIRWPGHQREIDQTESCGVGPCERAIWRWLERDGPRKRGFVHIS